MDIYLDTHETFCNTIGYFLFKHLNNNKKALKNGPSRPALNDKSHHNRCIYRRDVSREHLCSPADHVWLLVDGRVRSRGSCPVVNLLDKKINAKIKKKAMEKISIWGGSDKWKADDTKLLSSLETERNGAKMLWFIEGDFISPFFKINNTLILSSTVGHHGTQSARWHLQNTPGKQQWVHAWIVCVLGVGWWHNAV